MLTISDVQHGEHAIDISDEVDCRVELENTDTEVAVENIIVDIVPSHEKVKTEPTQFTVPLLNPGGKVKLDFHLSTSFNQGELIPIVTLQYELHFTIPGKQVITNALTIEPD